MAAQSFSAEELVALAEVLMGAALADGKVQEKEARVIRNVLTVLLEEDSFPDYLERYLDAFDPAEFDLERAIAALGAQTEEDRRNVLSLVARVVEIDDVHDLDETNYIVQVARALGSPEEEYRALVVAFSSGESESGTPPPMPRS